MILDQRKIVGSSSFGKIRTPSSPFPPIWVRYRMLDICPSHLADSPHTTRQSSSASLIIRRTVFHLLSRSTRLNRGNSNMLRSPFLGHHVSDLFHYFKARATPTCF